MFRFAVPRIRFKKGRMWSAAGREWSQRGEIRSICGRSALRSREQSCGRDVDAQEGKLVAKTVFSRDEFCPLAGYTRYAQPVTWLCSGVAACARRCDLPIEVLVTAHGVADPWKCLGPVLAERAAREREQLIENLWRRAPGLAVRLSTAGIGVIERLGRTRFDLEMRGADGVLSGAVRAHCKRLPFADGSIALVVLDSLGCRDGALDAELIAEATRVLTADGQLLVMDQGPYSWLRWRDYQRRSTVAPRSAWIAACLRNFGYADVKTEHALHWLPAPTWALERWGDRMDRWGRRLWPALGALYAVSGRKHANNVIAIPLGRMSARAGALAAPEGMRRAG